MPQEVTVTLVLQEYKRSSAQEHPPGQLQVAAVQEPQASTPEVLQVQRQPLATNSAQQVVQAAQETLTHLPKVQMRPQPQQPDQQQGEVAAAPSTPRQAHQQQVATAH